MSDPAGATRNEGALGAEPAVPRRRPVWPAGVVREPRWRSTLFAASAGLLIGLAGAPLELSFPAFLAPAALL
ncbi:MAG TPA: hypothetical protein VIL20_11965, partial [Sandaracinaceae bacterium]